jgi:hypothetical protein
MRTTTKLRCVDRAAQLQSMLRSTDHGGSDRQRLPSCFLLTVPLSRVQDDHDFSDLERSVAAYNIHTRLKLRAYGGQSHSKCTNVRTEMGRGSAAPNRTGVLVVGIAQAHNQ